MYTTFAWITAHLLRIGIYHSLNALFGLGELLLIRLLRSNWIRPLDRAPIRAPLDRGLRWQNLASKHACFLSGSVLHIIDSSPVQISGPLDRIIHQARLALSLSHLSMQYKSCRRSSEEREGWGKPEPKMTTLRRRSMTIHSLPLTHPKQNHHNVGRRQALYAHASRRDALRPQLPFVRFDRLRSEGRRDEL